MKRFRCWCLWLLLAALTVNLPAYGESAKSSYGKGQKAEARQDYEAAYKLFKQAYDKEPENTRYRSSYERMRFMAGAEHVRRGQRLREDGKLSEALAEFQAATLIDSSSEIARQEIRATQKLIDRAQHPETPPLSRRQSDNAASETIAGPVVLAPISPTPLTLKMNENSRRVYEAIGSLAGINVLFDSDYQPRPVHVELNGVSLSEALRIVALESHTFWRSVTPNTIFVASDTQQKRNELEQQVLRTFYLNNFSAVSELQDVANLIRTILRVERVQQFPSQNAIVMRGTPDQVALAELLINNLDKAKAEVVVDVIVMQVTKDKVKDLGISYPFSSSSNPTITFGTTSSTSSSSSTSTSTTSSSGLTLNDLAHLDATDFSVSIPSSSIAMLMTDSDTTILQRPQLRSLDGQKATMKIGERVPIATGTSSSTLTSTSLATTSFQYQDVGVNIEMTPHIHNEEVSMKLSIEVSAIDSYTTFGSGSSEIQEPVIGQRKIEHELRMHNGEVGLIGGMMEHDDTKSMSGLPWLSQIPGLRYLFGESAKEKKDVETVFVLVPHIVRRLDVDETNERAIDIGTQNVIEIRRVGKTPAPTSNNAPVPSSAPSMPAASPTVVPPIAMTPTANASPVLAVDPPMINVATGATFAVTVTLNGGQNVFSVPTQVHYDPKLLQFTNLSNAGALSKDGAAVAVVHRDDAQKGVVTISMMRPPGTPGVTPAGPLFTMTFVAKAAGQASLLVEKTLLRDPAMAAIEASGSQAMVNIR